MASNYEVNIKLNTEKIHQQLKNLEKRISKLNDIAMGQKGAGKQLFKTERDKLALVTKTHRKEQRITDEKRKQFKLESQTTKTVNKRQGVSSSPAGGGASRRRKGGGFGGVLSSALISGGFPLLFGQGPGLAAAGALGGGIGEMFGKGGGFAGGIAATATVTGLINLKNAIEEVGKVLDPANINIDQSIEKLKIFNQARASEIKLIEQAQGTQAALAEVTRDTAKVIGDDGVNALREFAKTMSVLGGGFTETMLKVKELGAKVFNKIFDFAGGDLSKAKAELGKEDEAVKALNANSKALEELRDQPGMVEPVTSKDIMGSFDDFSGTSKRPLTAAGKAERDRLRGEKNILEFRVKQRAAQQAGATLVKEIGVEHKELLGTLDLQMATEQDILRLRKTGLNPALAQQILLVEKSSANIKKGIENQIERNEKLLKIAKDKASAEGKAITDEIQFLELRLASLEKELDVQDDLLKKEKERIITQARLNRAAKIAQDSFESLRQTISTDLADGIQGLVRGTTTLSKVLNTVVDRLIDAAFNMAFFGNVSGTLTAKSGLFGNLFFRANGGPVAGGKSYVVGERGPELFTPGVSGSITPNHALGGSTNVVVNVDASGSSVEGREEEGRQLGIALSAAIESELIKQKRPGGLLA